MSKYVKCYECGYVGTIEEGYVVCPKCKRDHVLANCDNKGIILGLNN